MNNKLLFIPEWHTVGTISTPEPNYKALYPKANDSHWYLVSSDGSEKRIETALDVRNGITTTTYATSSVFRARLDVALGLGLTFSGNFAGSTISVFNVTTNMLNSLNTATAGYVLTSNGTTFNWVPTASISNNITGTVNKLAKFNTTTSLGDSLITDDGVKIVVGATPSFAVSLLNVDGSMYMSGYLYLADSLNTYIRYSNGVEVQTDKDIIFRDELGYNYLDLKTDNISSYTFSILESTLVLGDNGTFSYILSEDIDSVSFGVTSSTMTFSMFSSSPGVLRLKDTTEGANKVFVSDSDGYGRWQNLRAGSGMTVSGITYSVRIGGTGLTFSSNALTFDYTILGSTLTQSAGLINLSSSGVTAGVYGTSNQFVRLTVDSYGRITDVVTYTYSVSGPTGPAGVTGLVGATGPMGTSSSPYIFGSFSSTILPQYGTSSVGSTGSVVLGGELNTASGYYNVYGHAVVAGGFGNQALSHGSFIGGGLFNYLTPSTSGLSTISGGYGNSIVSGNSAYYSVIVGGLSNLIDSEVSPYTSIGGGRLNKISGSQSTWASIGGGFSNTISGYYSGGSNISGGYNNTVSGNYSAFSNISGGQNNLITNSNYGVNSVISGGRGNQISGTNSQNSTISGGYTNCISGNLSGHSVISGGGGNIICGDNVVYSTIGGGDNNYICGYNSGGSVIGGGCGNIVSATLSTSSIIAGGFANQIKGDCSSNSVISGGYSNYIDGICSYESVISGGCNNLICGSFLFGGVISGGKNNNIIGNINCYSSIAGGCANSICVNAKFSNIGGGESNTIDRPCYSVIAGGFTNLIQGVGSCFNAIGGGAYNQISGNGALYSVISGGYLNIITSAFGVGSVISGGFSNSNVGLCNRFVTISGGSENTASAYQSCFSVISGGELNSVCGTFSEFSVISGGRLNTVSSAYGSIVGGCSNTISSGLTGASIIGIGITASAACTLHVNCLSIVNIPGSSASLPVGMLYRDGENIKIKI